MAITTITINTTDYRVAVHYGNKTEYIGHRGTWVSQPDDAVFFDIDEAEEQVENIRNLHLGHATATIEPVTKDMSVEELCEAIANVYNTQSTGWDYQHCGGVREEDMADMIAKLDNTLFCGADIRKAVPDILAYVDEENTIEGHAEYLSQYVGHHITKCQFQSVSLFITLKK